MRRLHSILVTGGAGFIGSNFIRFALRNGEFSGQILNVDCLKYSGNLANLKDVEAEHGEVRYRFENCDICDYDRLEKIFLQYDVDTVVHFAAESHVDRSIHGPAEFVRTNIQGTFTLLEVARKTWKDRNDVLFHQISTDEVYGSLGEVGKFREETAYDPRSPYSASKAAADHLVRSYYHTYQLPVTISNCSNNYGPYQYPEKLIPLMIDNMVKGKPLPVYGDGKNVRDWIYVIDHVEAIWRILQEGCAGESYNVGGDSERCNIDLVNLLCENLASILGKKKDAYKPLISFVQDRAGHDRRYAIDSAKIQNDLGWKPNTAFDEGIKLTVQWYINNQNWLEGIHAN